MRKNMPIMAGLMLITLAILISFSTVSCRTLEGMKNEPLSEGEERIFDADYNKVLKATQESIFAAGLQMEDSNEISGSTWMILAREPASLFSYGTLVRVVIVKLDANRSAVRIITRRKLATNVTAKGDFSQEIFSAINIKLAGK